MTLRARQQAHERGEHVPAGLAEARRRSRPPEHARADDEVRLVGDDRLEDGLQLAGSQWPSASSVTM